MFFNFFGAPEDTIIVMGRPTICTLGSPETKPWMYVENTNGDPIRVSLGVYRKYSQMYDEIIRRCLNNEDRTIVVDLRVNRIYVYPHIDRKGFLVHDKSRIMTFVVGIDIDGKTIDAKGLTMDTVLEYTRLISGLVNNQRGVSMHFPLTDHRGLMTLTSNQDVVEAMRYYHTGPVTYVFSVSEEKGIQIKHISKYCQPSVPAHEIVLHVLNEILWWWKQNGRPTGNASITLNGRPNSEVPILECGISSICLHPMKWSWERLQENGIGDKS